MIVQNAWEAEVHACAKMNIQALILKFYVSFFIEMCVALNFVNRFGLPCKLYSSLKYEGYIVTGFGFKLKLLIDRPELHSHVTFYAEDPSGKNKILLNGVASISEPAISGCPEFLTVSVTPDNGMKIKIE